MTSPRPLIAVDLCNTVADIDPVLRRILNVPTEVRQRDLWRFGATTDFFRSAQGLKVFAEVAPIAGAVEGVRELIRSGFEVAYVTARPVEAVQTSRVWLARHGFPRPSAVYCTDDKVATVRRLGAVVAIDDWPPEVARLSEAVPVVIHSRWFNERGFFGYKWSEIPAAVKRAAAISPARMAA